MLQSIGIRKVWMVLRDLPQGPPKFLGGSGTQPKALRSSCDISNAAVCVIVLPGSDDDGGKTRSSFQPSEMEGLDVI